MSAFMVTRAHIDTLTGAAMERRRETGDERIRWRHPQAGRVCTINETNVHQVGDMLTRMNHASVDWLYRSGHGADGNGPGYPEPYRFTSTPPAEPAAVLKALRCYEYQACEHPSWDGSEAQAFCAALRLHVIEWLPGYQAAPWEIADGAGVAR